MKIKLKFIIFLICIISLNLLVGCKPNNKVGQIFNMINKKYSINNSLNNEKHQNNNDNIIEDTVEEREEIDENIKNDSLVKLIFIGDTMMDSKVALAMDQNGNDYPLIEFMPILKNSDLVIGNLETSIGTSRDLMEKSYAFQTHPSRFSLFEPIKDKTVFSIANNHGMDGPLDETLNHIKELEYPYVGIGKNVEEAFKPYVTTINDISIAIIGASRVIPVPEWTATQNRAGMATVYSPDNLIKTIKKYRENVDFVITYIHWGEERVDKPNKTQLDLEKVLIDEGVDLIIGSHPHVLQEIKWHTDKQLTAYSLGNFVFTTANNPLSNDTVALEIHLSKNRIEHVQLWPGQVSYGIVRSLENSEEKTRIFKRLEGISEGILINENGVVIRKNKI